MVSYWVASSLLNDKNISRALARASIYVPPSLLLEAAQTSFGQNHPWDEEEIRKKRKTWKWIWLAWQGLEKKQNFAKVCEGAFANIGFSLCKYIFSLVHKMQIFINKSVVGVYKYILTAKNGCMRHARTRAWRDISISKNLVRFSNEISRSTTRYFFQNLVPVSKFEIWWNKFSISSRSTRCRRHKSRSRLEPRD